MGVLVVTPPASPLVDIDTLRAHLKVDDTFEDALIGVYAGAVAGTMDGPGGDLGRSFGAQVLKVTYDAFAASLEIPFPPLRQVDWVKYLDDDGAEQTLSTDVYEVVPFEDRHVVQLKPSQLWPCIPQRSDAVSIQFQAGYATLPARYAAAVLLMVHDLYTNRSTQVIADAAQMVKSDTVQTLLGRSPIIA
jgi:uncharacterized phiE125 gp8 family phage protein